MSLPFIPDLHEDFMRLWDKPFSAGVHTPLVTSYANIRGMAEHGYARMPQEDALVSYLVPGAASSWKAPALPQTLPKAHGQGICCGGPGQKSPAHHVGATGLSSRPFDLGEVVPQDKVLELCKASDLALQTTKHSGLLHCCFGRHGGTSLA